MKIKLKKGISKTFILRLLLTLALLWLGLFFYLRNPILPVSSAKQRSISINELNLRQHVEYLAAITPSRNFQNSQSMLQAEDYIQNQFKSLGYKIKLQDVNSAKETYHNVIVRYGNSNSKSLIVIGAHYDVHNIDNPGADDNASGIAGLIEIARLLQEKKPQLNTAIELVAYTLEEPPFFGDHTMGSAHHADQLKNEGINVQLMVSLEMLGFYSEDFLSQDYPIPLLYSLYPATGNFISIVGRPADRALTRSFKLNMSEGANVPVFSVNAPAMIPGIDYSDHRSYWTHDWPALMVTDTAFFRNHEYHKAGDTPDRLNYKKMADVVAGVYMALTKAAAQ